MPFTVGESMDLMEQARQWGREEAAERIAKLEAGIRNIIANTDPNTDAGAIARNLLKSD